MTQRKIEQSEYRNIYDIVKSAVYNAEVCITFNGCCAVEIHNLVCITKDEIQNLEKSLGGEVYIHLSTGEVHVSIPA